MIYLLSSSTARKLRLIAASVGAFVRRTHPERVCFQLEMLLVGPGRAQRESDEELQAFWLTAAWSAGLRSPAGGRRRGKKGVAGGGGEAEREGGILPSPRFHV